MTKRDMAILCILMLLMVSLITFVIMYTLSLEYKILPIEINESIEKSSNESSTEEISTYSTEESIEEFSTEEDSECTESSVIEESSFEEESIVEETSEASNIEEPSEVEENNEESSEESDIRLMGMSSNKNKYEIPYNSNYEYKYLEVYNSGHQVVQYLKVTIYNYELRYNYLNDIYNCFINIRTDYSIPDAALLAQAYNEGGAGRQGIYPCSNNCFGIKANEKWKGKVYSQLTVKGDGNIYISYDEAIKAGVPKLSLYRVYTNIYQSVEDYVKFIHEQYDNALWKNSLPCSKVELYSNNFKFNCYNYPEIEIRNSYLGSILWDGYGERFAINDYANIIKDFNLFEPAKLKDKILK